jgi:hypothetical protein
MANLLWRYGRAAVAQETVFYFLALVFFSRRRFSASSLARRFSRAFHAALALGFPWYRVPVMEASFINSHMNFILASPIDVKTENLIDPVVWGIFTRDNHPQIASNVPDCL